MTPTEAQALIANLESAYGRAEEAGTADAARCERELAAARAEMLAALVSATIAITPIEVLALKKLALINNALALSLKDASARREQTALLRVLTDVTARAALANQSTPEQRT